MLSEEPNAKRGEPPPVFIGVSLVVGFCLMFVVDQIATYCFTHGEPPLHPPVLAVMFAGIGRREFDKYQTQPTNNGVPV